MADFVQTTNEEDSPTILRRLERVEGKVERLEIRMDRLEARLARLESKVDELGRKVDALGGRMDRLEGRFSNVEGDIYENKARRRAVGLVMRYLDLPNPVMILSQDSGNVSLNNRIQAAIRANKITLEQWDELQEADIIVAGEDGRYVLIEASMTAGDSDVIRAANRAVMLAAVTNTEVIPAVVAANIYEPQRTLADEKNVMLFSMQR